MANISQNVNIEMLEKLPDGTYKKKHPETKASQVKLGDTEGNFVATDVEGAMNELFTNVSSGKDLVGGAITDVDDSVVIPTDPTFQELASAIGGISTGYLTEPVEPGAGVVYVDNTFKSVTTISSAIVKQAKVLVGGVFRVGFSLRTSISNSTVRGRVYINNSSAGVRREHSSNSYALFEEDFVLNKGDIVQLQLEVNYPNREAHNDYFGIGVKLPELAQKEEV